MADVFGKQVDLSGLLKEIQDAASQLKMASEDAGESIGVGWDDGFDYSINQIKASSIKISSAFKNLRDKITKQVQQFSTEMNGKKMRLKIDFSDIDLNSADIKKRISDIFKDFETGGFIEFDTKGSEKQFQNLIELYVKYAEKLKVLQNGMSSIKDASGLQKSLQEQYVLAKKINEIHGFLNSQTNAVIPLESYSRTIRKTEELLTAMSGLEDATKNVADKNVDGLADSLQKILKVLQEIKAAFEPLNKALTTEGTAFSKMAKEGSASLDTLVNKLQELSNMVDTLNKKEFNVTNLITQKGNVSESVSILKSQAKTLLDVVKQLVEAQNEIYKTNNAVYQTAMRQSGGAVGSSLWELQGFDATDLTKKITKSGSEAKLLEHISTLEYYKDTVLRIINEINKVAPNTIDTSAILSKLNAVQQAAKDSTSTEQQGAQTQDGISDVVDKIKSEHDQIEAEFKSIRQVIENTFDFSTLSPDLANVQTITDKIYQQFVELQTKIKALDFGIETSSFENDILNATNAIKQEGEAAESAAAKKQEFTKANVKVAESSVQTAQSTEKAAENIKEEGQAAKNASELLAMHGITTKNLINALKAGAFPSPSIALTKPDVYDGGYGDATVVFKNSAIDPSVNPTNKIYGVDAYTPTYPSFGFELNEDALKRAAEKTGIELDELRIVCGGAHETIEDALGHLAFQSFEISNQIKDSYLKDRGIKIETVEKDEPIQGRFHDPDNGDDGIHNGVLDILTRKGITFDSIVNDDNVQKEYFDAIRKYANDFNTVNAELIESYPRFAIEESIISELENRIKSARTDKSIYDEERAIFDHDQAVLRGERKVIDNADYFNKRSQAISDNRVDYINYVKNVFEEALVKPFVRGIDGQTFDRTPDGIAEAMASYGGKNALYNQNPFMRKDMDDQIFIIGAAKNYKSVAEAEADADRLAKDAPGGHTKLENGHIDDIARTIAQANNIEAQDAFDKIAQAVDGNTTAESIGKALRDSGLTVDSATVDKLAVAAQEAANVQTRYFEAKPQRALSTEDIAFVSLPKGTYRSDTIKEMLDAQGIPYVDHDLDDKGSREAALIEGMQKFGDGAAIEKAANAQQQLATESQETASAMSALKEEAKSLKTTESMSASAEKIAEQYSRSGRKWDELSRSTLESRSKLIADSFNDYISTAGINVSDINTSFLDKTYKTEDGSTGLYEVVKLVAKGTDALGEVVTITQEYNMASGALEKEATRFQDAVNKFDLATAKNTAESQVQELKSQMGSFKIDTTELEEAQGGIVDEESFDVFNEKLKNAKQRLAEIKTMLKSSKSLDPLVNSENMMSNLDATVKTYQENIKKFADVEGYDKLEQALTNITAKQKEFNDAKQAGDGTKMAAAVAEINKEMASYDANLKLVNARYQERNRLADESAKDDKLSADIEKQASALAKQQAQWQKNGQLTEEVRSEIEAMSHFLTEVTSEDDLAAWKNQWAILKNEVMATKHEASDAIAELKKSSGVDTSIRAVGEDNVSADLKQKITEYKQLITELQDMMSKLSSNPELANDTTFVNNLTDTALKAKNARTEIEGIFNEAQKLQKLGDPIAISTEDVSKLDNLKAAMITFANSALDGEVKVQGFNKEETEMYATITKSTGAVENITVALNGATGRLQAFTTGTSRATNEWEDFKTKAVAGAKNLIGMYVGFQEGVQAVRKGVEYVKEIDLAMTELKKVTDETDASYKEFLKDAGSTSAVIGSTISDFTEASATFARLGYDLEQSASMAETAIVYKNVADGLDSVEESSQSIISTMMAFGIEANDTMSIIDRFNAVGKICADYKVA